MKILTHEQTIPGAVRPIHLSDSIIFSDQESKGRSGHIGHAMTLLSPGRILDFYPNTSAKRCGGHAAYGLMEYRISEDYGKTFGEAQIFPYSWDSFLDGIFTVSVEKAVTAADGSVTAFCLRNSTKQEICCEPWYTPTFVRSEDGGKTWGDARELSTYRGRIYDAIRYGDAILVLEFCNSAEKHFCGNEPDHLYRLFQSDDNGKTFYEKCVVPFPDTMGRGYGNMIVTPDNRLIVYAYNLNAEDRMDYIISPDGGSTWEAAGVSVVEKCIRNPQVGLLDGQYILHGRAGENRPNNDKFVLYTSADGIHWNEGTFLSYGRTACFYSNNLVVRGADGIDRMLMQYSENYNDPNPDVWTGQVNTMHLWVESVR